MADETKKTDTAAPATTVASAAAVADTRLEDALKLVKAQSAQLAEATAKIEEAEKEAKFAASKIDALERKLKASKAAPTGDVVYLDGKSWVVKGTVKAKFALDEVKKGHILEDVTLVVIDRLE
jgi:hypothetical protein